MFLSQISPVSICAVSVLAPKMVTKRNSIYYDPSATHWIKGLHQKFVNNYVYHETELGRNGTLNGERQTARLQAWLCMGHAMSTLESQPQFICDKNW